LKNTQTRKSAFVKRDSHMLKPAVRNKNRFVGWARFFAHAERLANTWAKKRAHPTKLKKQ